MTVLQSYRRNWLFFVVGCRLTELPDVPKMGTYDSAPATLWSQKRFGDVVDFVSEIEFLGRKLNLNLCDNENIVH